MSNAVIIVLVRLLFGKSFGSGKPMNNTVRLSIFSEVSARRHSSNDCDDPFYANLYFWIFWTNDWIVINGDRVNSRTASTNF